MKKKAVHAQYMLKLIEKLLIYNTMLDGNVKTCPSIDGFVQERRNSSVLAMELRLSCTNQSIY